MKTCFVISQIGEENSTQRLEADKVLKLGLTQRRPKASVTAHANNH